LGHRVPADRSAARGDARPPLLGEMGRATVPSRRECRAAAIWLDGFVVREVMVSRAVGWNIECL
jgi:hypothetical protein